jgi:porin
VVWLLLTLIAAAPPACAQTAPAGQQNLDFSHWFDWQNMTGNWGGLRTDLQNDGVILRGHYVSEVSGNPVGGKEQGGAYADEFMLGADVDSKLFGWDGGTFHLTLTERAGSSLSKDKIGNILTVQEIYGDGQTVRLTELSYEQKLFGGRVDVEAGHINTENDFASSPVYFGGALWCNFQSNAICGTPIAAPINSSGYVAYPASNWGARVKLYPTGNTYLEAGSYAVDPTMNDASNGLKLGFNDLHGVFTTVESGVVVGRGAYLGNYRVGLYYDNSDNAAVASQLTRYVPAKDSAELMSLPLPERAGRYGGWAIADQTIELDPGNHQRGVVLFAALEWGDRATALIPWYGEAGLLRQGTFPGRDHDTIALGMAVAAINSSLQADERKLGAPTSLQEYVAELNYGITLAPWLLLRPGVQYIWHPSGINEIPNALVIDLKTVATF